MVEACYKNCSCPDLINSSVKIGIGERERKKLKKRRKGRRGRRETKER
jgi:hypothetical protein